VGQYKFTLWKTLSRKNFSEFIRFSLKGLNPLKI
jgi:hypothetical protein